MNNLRQLRKEHGLRQVHIARELGCTRARISLAELTRVSPELAEEVSKLINENMFAIMGTDVLKVLPKTKEDKENLIKVIMEIEVI